MSLKRKRRISAARRERDRPYAHKTRREPDAFTRYVDKDLGNSQPVSAKEEFEFAMRIRRSRTELIFLLLAKSSLCKEICNYLFKRTQRRKKEIKKTIAVAIRALDGVKKAEGSADSRRKAAEVISALGVGYGEVMRWYDIAVRSDAECREEKSEAEKVSSSSMSHCIRELTAARDELIRVNLRLVVSIARAFSDKAKLPLADRVQEGNIGLMAAVDRFDPMRGYRFSTLATPVIWQHIMDPLRRGGDLLHIPSDDIQQLGGLDAIEFDLWKELHREPTMEETAGRVGIKPKKLLWLKGAQNIKFLDRRIGEDGKVSLGDLIVDTETPSPLEELVAARRRDKIDRALRRTTPREEFVMRLRFGITNDRKEREPHEIAKMFSAHFGGNKLATKQNIQQLEKRAKKKLRPRLFHSFAGSY